MSKKLKRFFIIFFSVMLVLFIACSVAESYTDGLYRATHTVQYDDFLELVEKDEVGTVVINYGSSSFTFYLTVDENTPYYSENPRYDDFKKEMLEQGIEVYEEVSSQWGSLIISLIPTLLIVGVFIWMIKSQTGNHEVIGVMGNNKTVTFKDVAGLHEVKQDLMGVVDMLKDPKKYEEAGARISKGAILYGPPGTGKTLLARAVSGEAGVNFISVSGADFSNKFIGAGADRVRKLFSNAKKVAPCIVFIDELDAVGGTREGAHTENKNTIDALLTCMDGFDKRDGIFVIAATNRLEDLDSALVRPGRFDSKFAVPLPSTTEERMEVIEVYKRGKKFDETVDFNVFAKQLIGNSPADIEAIMNEAAILAARKNGMISKADLDEAYLKKILKGHVKNDDKDAEAKKLVAYHEAGHALVGVLTGQEVTKVTAQSTTSGAGGFTLTAPNKMGLFSKQELINRVLMLYGGRAAEELLVGKENITTGASNDIEVATNTLYQLIAKYGMCENGPAMLNYERVPGGEKIIADKMNAMATELYKQSFKLLADNSNKLEALAEELIKKESLSETEILEIINAVPELN